MSKGGKTGALAVAIVAGVAFIIAGVWLWRVAPNNAEGPPKVAGLQQTLDPGLFEGEVRDAYQAARQHPDILVQLHCYCGCDREMGHRSLLDCFRTRHGSQCEICTGEANMAARMAEQGMPVDEIISAIRARYAHGD